MGAQSTSHGVRCGRIRRGGRGRRARRRCGLRAARARGRASVAPAPDARPRPAPPRAAGLPGMKPENNIGINLHALNLRIYTDKC